MSSVEWPVLAAILIGVLFRAPFDEAYRHGFDFEYAVDSELTKYTSSYTVNCAECGIKDDFTVDVRLAFSIEDGVTEGRISPVNHSPFIVDAVSGLNAEQAKTQFIKGFWER